MAVPTRFPYVGTIELQRLTNVYEALKPLEGLKFEFQGEIQISKPDERSVRFAIAPLEWITLSVRDRDDWSVSFTINDADGHGLPWEHRSAYGHVINSLRGYIINKCYSKLNIEQLLSVIKLE